MKKLVFSLVCISTTISFISCGNNKEKENLLRMRDSIQVLIETDQHEIDSIYMRLDSLYNNDRLMYGMNHNIEMRMIDRREQDLKEQQDKLFQIDLQLNK